MAYFDALTTTQVAALTTAQVAALTSDDLQSITSVQLPFLSTSSIQALTTSNIVGIPTSAIPALTTTQVVVLETRDLASLTSAQISAFETSDIKALSTAQLSSLGATQMAGLTAAQLDNLTTAQVAALNVNYLPTLQVDYSAQGVIANGNNPTFLVTPPNPMEVAIPTGTTWSSGMIPMNGYNSVVVGILADKILTVTVQRYIDGAGTLPVGAAGTLTSTANTAGYTSVLSSNVPATHFKVTVSNATGDTAIVSKFAIAVQSN